MTKQDVLNAQKRREEALKVMADTIAFLERIVKEKGR
jgi:hypothetical protein